MRIVFSVTAEARADLVRLLEPRVPQPLDAVLRAGVILDDVQERVQQHGGPPPEAHGLPGTSSDEFWWEYVHGLWLGMTVRDARPAIFRPLVRTVTLIAAVAHRPRG